MRTVASAAVIIILAASAFAGADRQWQEAVLLDQESERVFVGMTGNSQTSSPTVHQSRSSGAATAIHHEIVTYVFETPERHYVASHRLRFRWSKPLHAEVNGPVQIAPEKGNLFVKVDGKEHKLRVNKVIRRSR